MTAEKKQTIDHTNQFNRLMYAGFVLISLYFLAVPGDMGTAMSNLGIALIFDPFDHRVTWAQRPFYQRAWLLVHVALVFALLGFVLIAK